MRQLPSAFLTKTGEEAHGDLLGRITFSSSNSFICFSISSRISALIGLNLSFTGRSVAMNCAFVFTQPNLGLVHTFWCFISVFQRFSVCIGVSSSLMLRLITCSFSLSELSLSLFSGGGNCSGSSAVSNVRSSTKFTSTVLALGLNTIPSFPASWIPKRPDIFRSFTIYGLLLHFLSLQPTVTGCASCAVLFPIPVSLAVLPLSTNPSLVASS